MKWNKIKLNEAKHIFSCEHKTDLHINKITTLLHIHTRAQASVHII